MAASVADITVEITPAQSIKHTATHEVLHAIGCDHTPDHRGVMADTSRNWERDRNILGGIDPTRPDAEFDQVCRGQIQIHNQ